MNQLPHRPGSAPSPSPPALWAVGGGKGGVGRTLLVANMGIQMARQGKKVAVADLDLLGSNLHSYLGIHRVPRTLERLTGPDEVPLASLLLDTSVSSLKLLAGIQRLLTPAERAAAVERFLRQAASLPVDFVLVDCGSGRSPETLDLFRAAGRGILVATPEPISTESLYLFAEALLQRVVECRLSSEDLEKLEIARIPDPGEKDGKLSFRTAVERLRREKDPCCERILEALRPLRLRLVLNQVRTDSEGELSRVLKAGFEKFFGLELRPVGSVEYDLSVLQATQKGKPLSQQYPNSAATQGVERAVTALLTPFRDEGSELPPLARDLSTLDHYRLLEVDPGASSREIQLVYQILKRAYEPDSLFLHPLLSPAQIEQVGGMIDAAYRTLIFLETRTEYDRRLVADGILRPEQARQTTAEPALEAQSAPPTPEEAIPPLPPVKDAKHPETSGAGSAPEAPSRDGQAPGRGQPVTGATLRQYREARKLALEAIVERTKIRPAILEALEEDRFSELPAPVFLKGFLRQLAVCLGLDPAVVSREYMARIPPAPRTNSRRDS